VDELCDPEFSRVAAASLASVLSPCASLLAPRLAPHSADVVVVADAVGVVARRVVLTPGWTRFGRVVVVVGAGALEVGVAQPDADAAAP
jgi:hypothetical protein